MKNLDLIIEELSSLRNVESQVPAPSPEDERKFRKILQEGGRASMTVDLDSTLESVSSVSWRPKKGEPVDENRKKTEDIPPPVAQVSHFGLGRGRPLRNREDVSSSIIIDDISEFLKKM